MVGEGRRRALVDEHAAGAEAVPAATGRGVVDRQAGAVVAMEPAEGYPGQARVAGLAGHLPRGDERHHQRRGVQWLLVTGFRRLRALGARLPGTAGVTVCDNASAAAAGLPGSDRPSIAIDLSAGHAVQPGLPARQADPRHRAAERSVD